jgi:hypothetical protein
METTNWDAWLPLIGSWVGEGGGDPGQGAGTVSFSLELDGRILVRKNHLDFPATPGRPASAHDDLLVTYREADGSLRADYFDNEDHAIHYAVTVFADGTILHLSDIQPAAPRFRMTYTRAGADSATIRFEIAPAGRTIFRPTWSARPCAGWEARTKNRDSCPGLFFVIFICLL